MLLTVGLTFIKTRGSVLTFNMAPIESACPGTEEVIQRVNVCTALDSSVSGSSHDL